MTATFEELIKADEIGDRIAQSILDFSSDLGNIQLINRLKSYGLQLEVSAAILENQTEILLGQIFVVSGVFYQMSRNELKKAIEDNGGKVSSSISKKTNFIVAGDNMGPSKLTKAQDLGISIISEQDFIYKIS
jgi:DNA ligase (NAD+)